MQREDSQLTLVCDSRQPEGGGWEPYFSSPTIRQKLDTGDYSILGAEHLVAVERKSLSDLLSSLTHERDRFERELARGKGLDFFAVIIEASASDVRAGTWRRYGQGCNPKAIWESVCCFSVRYAPFLFASDRITGAKMCESLLLKWARERQKTVESIMKGSRSIAVAEKTTGRLRQKMIDMSPGCATKPPRISPHYTKTV